MLMIIEVWIMPIIFIFAPEVSHPDFSAVVGWSVLFRSKRRESWIVLGRKLLGAWALTPSIHGFFMAKKNGGDPKYLLIGMIIQVGLMVIGSVS